MKIILLVKKRSNIGVCTIAPTWQSAFSWFRDNHGMFPRIQTYRGEDIDRFKGKLVHFWEIDFLNSYCDSDTPFKSYEEAQEACLEKLCEIVEKTLEDGEKR